MTIRIGINGFGRINRLTFRRIMDLGEKSSGIEVAVTNDSITPALLAHLLKYDSTHDTFDHKVPTTGDSIVVDGKEHRVYVEPQAQNIPWVKNDGVNFVLECTGFYTGKAESEAHLKADARCILVPAPAGSDLKTVVYGVNDDTLTAGDKVVSVGSYTTNSLAPMVNALQKEFGIEVDTMTTICTYTPTQMLLDDPVRSGNLRSARAAATNIILHSTGATKAIGLTVPELDGKLNGHAQRVPVPDGSVVELVSILSKNVTADEVNGTVKKYENPSFAYNDHNIVFSDVLGTTAGSVFDPTQTMVTAADDKQLVKTVAWYSNKYSFTYRMVHTLLKFAIL